MCSEVVWCLEACLVQIALRGLNERLHSQDKVIVSVPLVIIGHETWAAAFVTFPACGGAPVCLRAADRPQWESLSTWMCSQCV